MPRVVVSRLVDLGELVFVRVDLVCGLLCGIAGDVANENGGIAQKLSELAVAEDECAQRSEALESLLSVLLGGVLVDRRVGSLGVTTSDLLCLTDEVLEKIASCWPSEDSFFDGVVSCFHASALFIATSICLLDGTLPLANAE